MKDGHSRVILIVAAMALPPAVGLSGRHWVAEHPVLATGLLVGYELALVLLGFAGQVWGGLRSEWARRLSVNIDQAVGRRVSRFERHYREYMTQSHRFVDQKGLATFGDRTPELDDVFVDVSLASRAPQQISGAVLSEPPVDVTERRSVWDFLNDKASSPVVLAIVGAPGSGKTTLLRHTARFLGRTSRRPRGLPVLLLLRESAAAIVADPNISLPSMIATQIRGTIGQPPTGWFDQRLGAGRCVVMLDGLDEIARQEHRQGVVDWVDRQIARYPGNDYLITSRPHGYETYPLERAAVLQVRRFTPTQIARFVRGWYLAVERSSTGTNDEYIKQKALEEAKDLLARARETPALADLAANPLLLTMITNVHRYRGALPGTRAELYAEMCAVLLGRRQQAKKLVNPLRADQKELILRELAFTMMRDRVRDLTSDRISDLIRNLLPRVSSVLDADDFLEDIRSSGMMLEREYDLYSFAHHTFQEYLASAYIRERRLLEPLLSNVGDPWWREVALLYAARADAGPIVEACLASGGVTTLALAFDCADAASELAPALRSRLDELLGDAANPAASSERRRLAAAVTASRQLRNTVRLENGSQLCSMPVSRHLYDLFVNEMLAVGKDHATQHPATYRASHANEPAVGIGAEDAVAFVEWLNTLLEGDSIYRLPTRNETTDPALNTSPVAQGGSFWTISDVDSTSLEFWVPQHRSHPYAISGQQVVKRAQADISGPIGDLVFVILALALEHTLAFARALTIAFEPELAYALERDIKNAHMQAREYKGISVNEDLIVLGEERAQQLNSEIDLTLQRAHKGAVQANVRARSRAYDRAFDPAFDPDLDVNNPVERARVRARTRRALAITLALNRARDLSIDLGAHLGIDRDLDRALDRSLGRAAEDVLDHASNFDRDLDGDVDSYVARTITGSGNLQIDLPMCVFLARNVGATEPRKSTQSFWGKILNAPLTIRKAKVLPPYSIRKCSMAALQRMQRLGAPRNRQALGAHMLSVASQIDHFVSVSDHNRSITSSNASYVRLGALTIAANADQVGLHGEVADTYIDIASGITLLERRTRGEALIDEMIVLICS